MLLCAWLIIQLRAEISISRQLSIDLEFFGKVFVLRSQVHAHQVAIVLVAIFSRAQLLSFFSR